MRHLVAGVALILLGLWGMSAWWLSFGLVMRGLGPFVLLGVGLLAVLSSYRRLAGDGHYDAVEDHGRAEVRHGSR